MDSMEASASQNLGTVVYNEPDSALMIMEGLHKHAQFKARSSETHDRDHAPVLAQGNPITCLLLGHSFFERFKTTGESTIFGPQQAQYPEVFNAGVGGDKICNIIYRLTEKGLLDSLRITGVKFALLAMGTNDLKNDKLPLQGIHVEQYTLILRALRWFCPGIRILVCGLAPKLTAKTEGIVEQSNEKLQAMVGQFAAEGPPVVKYLPSDPTLIHNLEPDGVHLNKNGYDMFAGKLWESYQAMRAERD